MKEAIIGFAILQKDATESIAMLKIGNYVKFHLEKMATGCNSMWEKWQLDVIWCKKFGKYM